MLLRALEPLEGLALMRRRRVAARRAASAIDRRHALQGPGNLRALGITLEQNRLDVTRSAISVEDWGLPVGERVSEPIANKDRVDDRCWRCYEAGSAAVSYVGSKHWRQRAS